MGWDDFRIWPTASDIAAQANVSLQVNCGSGSRMLEMLKMTQSEPTALASVTAARLVQPEDRRALILPAARPFASYRQLLATGAVNSPQTI